MTRPVDVAARPDPTRSRAPLALRKALAKDALARETWDGWAPSQKKNALTYPNFLESEAARDRTVRKLLAELRGPTGRA